MLALLAGEGLRVGVGPLLDRLDRETQTAALLVRTHGEDFRTFGEAFGVACNGKFSDVRLAKGDGIRIVTSGGGGYGSPLERDPARIEEDVRQGFITREQAEEQYGVVFADGGVEIDRERTRARRAAAET